MASHGGGGGWPGGAGGSPPNPLGGGSLFGDGSYSGNVIQGGSVLLPVGGVLTVTGAATVAPDADTGACVVMCDTLVIDGAAASLQPSMNSKGLVVYAKTGIALLNGARLNIDKLGLAGSFGNLTAYSLTPASIRRKLKTDAADAYGVLGEGAGGAPAIPGGYTNGSTGSAATALQTGGGGSGGIRTAGGGSGGGAGKGGPCCGGAGGGACYHGTAPVPSASQAGDYGGPGGNAETTCGSGYTAGGGAGNPVGVNQPCGGSPGDGAGGGLLMLFAPAVQVASGCIVSADGGNGGAGTAASGGGAGGGCVCIVTNSGGYTNSGTVRASGGTYGASSYNTGGAGGAGSVNTFTI